MKFRIPKINKVLALLSIIALGWQSASVHALDTAAAELAINNGISTLAAQQNTSEGGWGAVDGLDYVYTAAAVEALHASNHRSGGYYSGFVSSACPVDWTSTGVTTGVSGNDEYSCVKEISKAAL